MRALFTLLPVVSLLSACGGSGGGNDNPDVAASVNAGIDQQVIEKSEFTLTAIGSPANGTFSWQRINGPAVEGLPADGDEQTLTAPDVKTDSQLLLRVNYQTADGQLVSDDVMIDIVSNNQLPEAVVTQIAPAELPSDYKDTITLSGAESSDPDENGAINSYRWQQISGPTVAVDSYNNETISFSHPLLDVNTTLVWQLTVIDDEGGEASIQYNHKLNRTDKVVIANAGADQTVNEVELVTLDATASETVTETFSCHWEQIVGSVTLANQEQCITSFTAPKTEAVNTFSFEVTVTDSKGRTDADVVQINIESKPLGLINDTGVNACYNNTQQIACDSPDFPRQDAAVGRDSVVSTHINKVGAGDSAFDFTKLNEFADELPDNSSNFSCVRDNVTGLIWEVKSPNTGTLPNATSLREGQNHYTWYLNGETGVQGGSQLGATTTCSATTNCGLQEYVNAVNNSDYCGGTNWRVPTYTELMTLLDYSQHGQSLLIDNDYFVNTPTQHAFVNQPFLPYWTSQTAADGTSLSQAYIIDMSDGNDLAYPKSETAFVRLVRTAGASQ